MLQEQQIRKTISDYYEIIRRAEHLAKITGLEETYSRYYIDRISFSDEIDYTFEYKYEHDNVYESLPLKYLWMDDKDVIADYKAEEERKLAEEKARKEEEERKKKEAKEKADRTLYEELKAKYGNE